MSVHENRKVMARLHGDQRGLTLIEIMVVVVILAILATLIVPRVMDRPDEARAVKAKQDIQGIANALQLYRLDNMKYPTTGEGLQVLSPKYLNRLPIDPWKNPYLYLSPGSYGEFDIYSLGADGQEGGTGINADVGNWNLDQ